MFTFLKIAYLQQMGGIALVYITGSSANCSARRAIKYKYKLIIHDISGQKITVLQLLYYQWHDWNDDW